MAISLRIILSVLIGLVAITTAVIAFTPMYLVGLSSVQDTLGSLRANIVGRSQENLNFFISQPFALFSTIRDASRRGTFDISNTAAAVQLACTLAAANSHFLAVAMFIIFPYNLALCDPTDHTIIWVPNATNNGAFFAWLNVSYNASADLWQQKQIYNNSWAFRVAFSYPDLTVLTAGNGTMLPMRTGVVAPQMAAGGPLFSSTGAVIGAFRTEVRSDQMGAFLQKLGLSARARALVVDRTNQFIVGVSWGEKTWSLNATTRVMKIKKWVNLTDPLMLQVYNELGNATVIDTPAPFSAVLGSGESRVYVDMIDVARDRLLLRLVLAIPEVDFMGDVYAKRSATLGGIAGAVVATVLLGIVFAHLLTAPLERVSDRMYATATLEDNEEDDSPSVISEVREMQNAYGLMRVELNRTKAYLPQTLFHKEDEDCSDGDASMSVTENVAARSVSGGTTKSGTSQSARTTASSNSAKARARRKAGAAGNAAAGALNTGVGTTRKAVSVLIINVVGTHEHIAAAGMRFEGAHSRVVNAIAVAVRDQKGVLDTFHGDRFVATFNAANNIAAHSRRAAMAALTAHAEVHKLKEFNVATMGIASGVAHVGNMGSTAMMRFCTIGPVFTEAVALERLCKAYRNGDEYVWSLCVGAIARDAELELNVQYVDVADVLGQRQLLVSLESAKTATNDEWMYQLQQGDANNPFAAINEAMLSHYTRSGDAATKLGDALRVVPPTMHQFAGYRSLQRLAGQ